MKLKLSLPRSLTRLIAERPRPDEPSLARFYGTPRGGSDPQRPGWQLPDPAWEQAHLVYVPASEFVGWPPLANGQPVRLLGLHRKVLEPLRQTWQQLLQLGLVPLLHSFDGIHARRHMGRDPQRPLSLHARGAALDLDASLNPLGAAPQLHPAVVAVFEQCGWVWGGRWLPRDGMHFQWTTPLPQTVAGQEVR